MKKAFTILCAAMFSLASLPSFAQFKLGVTVGVSSNSIGYNLEDSDDEDDLKDATKAKIGYTVGLAAEYGFSEAVSLQTGLLLANKGYKIEFDEDGISAKQKTSLTYLEIPLNLAFKISNFQLHAGPYVGFGLSGKEEAEYEIGGESESEEGKFKFKNKVSESDLEDLQDDEDYLRRTDFGLNLGVGYRLGPVLVTATYSKGLSKLAPSYDGNDDDDDDKFMNKGISLAATWFFNK